MCEKSKCTGTERETLDNIEFRFQKTSYIQHPTSSFTQTLESKIHSKAFAKIDFESPRFFHFPYTSCMCQSGSSRLIPFMSVVSTQYR